MHAGLQSPETHACEEPSSSSCRAQTEEASAGAATIHGAMTEGEEAAIIDSELLQEEDIDSASQAAERLESIGDAACCLNDTFEVRTQALNACLAPPPSNALGRVQAAFLVKRIASALKLAMNLCACIRSGACRDTHSA